MEDPKDEGVDRPEASRDLGSGDAGPDVPEMKKRETVLVNGEMVRGVEQSVSQSSDGDGCGNDEAEASRCDGNGGEGRRDDGLKGDSGRRLHVERKLGNLAVGDIDVSTECVSEFQPGCGSEHSSGVFDKGLHRANTMPGESAATDKSGSPIEQPRLSRSKTEKRRQSYMQNDQPAQIFDVKSSARKQRKMLDRIATVKDDGTVEVAMEGHNLVCGPEVNADLVCGPEVDIGTEDVVEDPAEDIPPLQIVMLIVGTRGDVQPFIAIGKRLQEYGHRVRLATHSNFEEFVLTAGLEFYPLGGDPKVLADMVKNKGFLPSGPSEIPIQRKQIKEIINSLFPACREPYPESGIAFKAQAIIANPPAYGHIHVAEALGIPLHIFFTMPWTPTSEFPHPLSRVKQPAGYRLSYQIVDSLIWLGIRDMINDFRKKKLKLRPVTYLSGTQGSSSDVPTGYIWSPHLVPKPKDWGPKVDVVGFCFLDLATNYKPPESLIQFIEKDEKRPIYIGFGSLVSF
ncbi:Sterol 3-beta-glucosyltransferase [Nymphaea thermarum]|nr:Sterol 3-beta-glucosyltransferase [Nymphaea thermarum]